MTETPEKGMRARVYFEATDLGRKHLQEMTEEYRAFVRAVNQVIDESEL